MVTPLYSKPRVLNSAEPQGSGDAESAPPLLASALLRTELPETSCHGGEPVEQRDDVLRLTGRHELQGASGIKRRRGLAGLGPRATEASLAVRALARGALGKLQERAEQRATQLVSELGVPTRQRAGDRISPNESLEDDLVREKTAVSETCSMHDDLHESGGRPDLHRPPAQGA